MSLAAIASYTAGQCTWYLAKLNDWLPADLGNAKDWLHNAQLKGLPTGSAPQVGAIGVYDSGRGGAFGAGHVVQVIGFAANGLPVVTEMDWNGGAGKSDTRTLTADQASQVSGYIYPPGSASGTLNTATLAAASSGGDAVTKLVDGIPIVGGILQTGNFLTWVLGKLTDPATFLTLGWLGFALVLFVIGFHALTGMSVPGASAAVGKLPVPLPV